MLLAIQERVMLDNVLPKEGTYLTMILVEELRKCLRLTPSEIADWEVEEVTDESGRKTGAIRWNGSKVEEIDVDINEAATKIVRDALLALSKAEKVTIELLSLCRKFELPT